MLTPYPFQEEAIESVFMYYAKGGTGNPVVVMPTATGKSVVIAEFCKRVLQRWPRQRIICLTHVKELIEQNAAKLIGQWPGAPLGIFSAGLGQRDIVQPIIYGGVASVVNCVEKFGWRDLMLVDEAHLISPKEDSNYQDVIRKLRAINPNMKVIGFTATPYRLGQGMITDGTIFSDVCYDISSFDQFNKLIDEGYLSMLIPKQMNTDIDILTKDVKTTAGDYNQHDLQLAVDKEEVTYKACLEILEAGFNRVSWLVFASGIKHAEHIAYILQSMGIEAAAIHSKMPCDDADKHIKAFRNGELRCIVNYGKLTTGFDHPPIDLIAVLRPTVSTVLWVQLLGRGTRIAHGKHNCLVLDFARNTPRLGPINDPMIPRKRNKTGKLGTPPIRICPHCGVYNHARSTHCIACGTEFPKVQKLTPVAGTDQLVRRDVTMPEVVTFDVERVMHFRQQKMGKPPMIKVCYYTPGGLQMYPEYICLEHGGGAAARAREWWKARMGSPVAPPTTDEALIHFSKLRQPKRIRVWVNKKYPEVMGYEY